MGATVEITHMNMEEDTIECNFAKVKDGCLVIAHNSSKDDKRYVSDYIPLFMLQKIRIITDIKHKEDNH